MAYGAFVNCFVMQLVCHDKPTLLMKGIDLASCLLLFGRNIFFVNEWWSCFLYTFFSLNL